jgi:hypothetical protein
LPLLNLADPNDTSLYTEASYLMDAPEPTPNNSSRGGLSFDILPEENSPTLEGIAGKIQVKTDNVVAPYLFNIFLDPRKTTPQQSFTLFQHQFSRGSHSAWTYQEIPTMEGLIVVGVVLYFFTQSVFAKPKEKSVEEKLAEALQKYLEEGVRVRNQ